MTEREPVARVREALAMHEAGYNAQPAIEDMGDLLWRYDRMRKVLDQIADEQKVYKGHGDYDVIPACGADEAQRLAREVLNLP